MCTHIHPVVAHQHWTPQRDMPGNSGGEGSWPTVGYIHMCASHILFIVCLTNFSFDQIIVPTLLSFWSVLRYLTRHILSGNGWLKGKGEWGKHGPHPCIRILANWHKQQVLGVHAQVDVSLLTDEVLCSSWVNINMLAPTRVYIDRQMMFVLFLLWLLFKLTSSCINWEDLLRYTSVSISEVMFLS